VTLPEQAWREREAARDDADVAIRLLDALRQVTASDRPEVRRLCYARAAVAFRVGDHAGATLLLDRRPPAVVPEAAAEIEIQLTSEHAQGLLDGSLPTAALIARGEVATRGPVRRYLEVDPILRSLLGRDRPAVGRVEDGPAGVRPASGARQIARELLAIETRDLHKSFGRQPVLAGADLRIPEGVISVILGPSGTGKSVLLQHIIGLMKPNSGDVLVRGRSLTGMGQREILALRTEIGVMFQDGALFSNLNVYDNVAFPLRQHTDLGEDEVREAVTRRLEAVGLAGAAQAMPSTLSGGMKKRAGLARALVLEPSIVLCDEPDSGLDPVRTALLARLLAAQHAENGGTMVVITHNISLARQIGEHISVLWHGKVLESGMREDILASENAFVRQFLAGETEGPLGMEA
jgi:phospholipid/cholesterol/gamma-HCH transport system ATP-binding protein